MSKQDQRYFSYLLRVWRDDAGGKAVWRASLESVQTGERRGFAALRQLIAFLENGFTRVQVQCVLEEEKEKPNVESSIIKHSENSQLAQDSPPGANYNRVSRADFYCLPTSAAPPTKRPS